MPNAVTPENRADIVAGLEDRYEKFLNWLDACSPEAFELGPTIGESGKWTAGQHFDHIILSTKPMNQALRMPKMGLSVAFGKCNRPTRNYNETVEKYKSKLAAGGVASGQYEPPQVGADKKAQIRETLLKEKGKLIAALDKWSDEQLDTYVLPHPLIGKMTVRELYYFTIYHTERHTNTLQEQYAQ